MYVRARDCVSVSIFLIFRDLGFWVVLAQQAVSASPVHSRACRFFFLFFAYPCMSLSQIFNITP